MNRQNSELKKIQEEKDFEAAVHQNQVRRIYVRKPKRARDLINNIITRRGIAAVKSNSELQKTWDEVVGIDIANNTQVGSIRRGELEIIVANSSVMQLISFQKNEILNRINQHLQNGKIKNLRFRIGSIS